MRLDLHVHSTASDGSLDPAEVARAAARGGLDVISLADHDTTEGIGPASRAAASLKVEIIPAVEVSSTHEGWEVHVLGYFVDPSDPEFLAYQERALRRRDERMQEMVRRLRHQGVEVHFKDVRRVAHDGPGPVGRPHLARALIHAGVVDSFDDAFRRLIGNRHPAFVPTQLLEPAQAVRLIVGAGGIAVWAHPPVELLEVLLPGLVQAGLRGIEVYRPRTPPDRILRLESVARTAGLLISGGSDWHGPEGGGGAGCILRHRGGRRGAA
jgi:predicted metal-dependent phosphoesterase TrpH